MFVGFMIKIVINKVYIERCMKIFFIIYRIVIFNKCYVICILKLFFEVINVENENIFEIVWWNYVWLVVFWNVINKIVER